MNILVLLPSTSGRVDTVSQIVLGTTGRSISRMGTCQDRAQQRITHLSILVLRDIRPFEFGLPSSGATTDRLEHDMGEDWGEAAMGELCVGLETTEW